jgi:hypothetical protein
MNFKNGNVGIVTPNIYNHLTVRQEGAGSGKNMSTEKESKSREKESRNREEESKSREKTRRGRKEEG